MEILIKALQLVVALVILVIWCTSSAIPHLRPNLRSEGQPISISSSILGSQFYATTPP